MIWAPVLLNRLIGAAWASILLLAFLVRTLKYGHVPGKHFLCVQYNIADEQETQAWSPSAPGWCLS